MITRIWRAIRINFCICVFSFLCRWLVFSALIFSLKLTLLKEKRSTSEEERSISLTEAVLSTVPKPSKSKVKKSLHQKGTSPGQKSTGTRQRTRLSALLLALARISGEKRKRRESKKKRKSTVDKSGSLAENTETILIRKKWPATFKFSPDKNSLTNAVNCHVEKISILSLESEDNFLESGPRLFEENLRFIDEIQTESKREKRRIDTKKNDKNFHIKVYSKSCVSERDSIEIPKRRLNRLKKEFEELEEGPPEKRISFQNQEPEDKKKGGQNRKKDSNFQKPSIIYNMYASMGARIARRPWSFITIGILISLLSLGALRMRLKDRIRDGYTPENAPSRYETLVMREFLNATADPIMTIVLVSAIDQASMLRAAHLNETARLAEFLLNEFRVEVSSGSHTYSELCDPFCDINLPLQTFVNTLNEQMMMKAANFSTSEAISLQYPISKIYGHKIYLERIFFGVKLKNGNIENESPEEAVTNIMFIKVIMLLFRGDRSAPGRETALSMWELAAHDYLHTSYSSKLLRVETIGTEILDREMLDDGRKVMPYFAGGFLATVAFVFITVVGRPVIAGFFDLGRIWCATATIVAPTIAITLTYGIVSLLGLRVNSFLLILPYLVFGIGVDDGFLIMHAWYEAAAAARNIPRDASARHAMERMNDERLPSVLAEVGPSITVTTLTNVISFAVGAFSPTPEIRLFCFGTTLSLSLVYILQFLFLCPVLELTKRYERRVFTINPDSTNSKTRTELIDGVDICEETTMAGRIFEWHCALLSSRLFAFMLAILMAAYWYGAVRGILRIETRLDATKVLPRGSKIQQTNRVLDECVWNEYHSVTVLINKQFDLQNRTQLRKFFTMVRQFEKIPKCRGSESSMIWLREYYEFLMKRQENSDDFDMFGLLSDVLLPDTTNSNEFSNSLELANNSVSKNSSNSLITENLMVEGVHRTTEESPNFLNFFDTILLPNLIHNESQELNQVNASDKELSNADETLQVLENDLKSLSKQIRILKQSALENRTDNFENQIAHEKRNRRDIEPHIEANQESSLEISLLAMRSIKHAKKSDLNSEKSLIIESNDELKAEKTKNEDMQKLKTNLEEQDLLNSQKINNKIEENLQENEANVDDIVTNLNEKLSNVTEMMIDEKMIEKLATLNTCFLEEFLDSSFHRHWSGFLHYKKEANSKCLTITRFWFTIAYQGTAAWEDRIELMLRWREIAQTYSLFLNATVWEQNAMFVDQMLSLKTTTIQSGALTLCCMIIICALFVSNPFSVLIASAVIASICAGVFGFLSFMQFDLDPITMAALLMSIGLSVDYTAHFAYHFQQNACIVTDVATAQRRCVPLTSRTARLRHTLRAVGWPLVQAAVSTALCVLPLVFVKRYAAEVFFSTIGIVTALGLVHGLVVLPCALVHLPSVFSRANFYSIYCSSAARRAYSPNAQNEKFHIQTPDNTIHTSDLRNIVVSSETNTPPSNSQAHLKNTEFLI